MAAQNHGVGNAVHPGPTTSLVRHLATMKNSVKKQAAGQSGSNHRAIPDTSYDVLPPTGPPTYSEISGVGDLGYRLQRWATVW